MMWSLWEEDCKMLKKYLDHWSKKRVRNKWYKTTFMIVSRKHCDEYEYVKLVEHINVYYIPTFAQISPVNLC